LGRIDIRVTGTGTTVVAALVCPSRVVIAHLGDSRAYLYRENALERLTADHNLIEALVDAGEVSEAEAAGHPGRNMLTRHVAMPPPALPDTCAVELQPGGRILLCSDGLHGVVDDSVISEILGSHGDPGDACDALIDAANHAGGPDNITAVVIDIPDSGAESAEATAPQEVS
jgi:serine/threonine protein phosphatase PrpC